MPSREVARAHICAHLFNLATPATSLLVLENVRQHLTNGIEPPRSRPALYAEYRRLGDDWHAWGKHSNECRQVDRLNKVGAGWWDHILETRGTDTANPTPTPHRPRRVGHRARNIIRH